MRPTPVLAPLCALLGAVHFSAAARAAAQPTFTHDVAPIVFNNCMTCHRPGEAGPFPLTDYSEVRRKARSILKAVDAGIMPPWHAQSHGEFLDERRLDPSAIAALHAWVANGEPEGNPVDLPPAPHFTDGWQAGPPDLILDPGDSYPVPAEGPDIYRCFVIPTHETENRWVSAVEVRPGNRSIVHHALLYLDTTGRARQLDAADPGLGYTSFGGVGFVPQGGLSGWAPGHALAPLPAGVGYFLPKGADVVLQVHYHKSGKAETDRTKVGLYFSREPVDKRYRAYPLAYRGLRIAAGDPHYVVHRDFPLSPDDITVLSITPHMHLLGKQMKVTVTLPDGTAKTLIDVTNWDFNWQTTYRFREPLKIPRGSQFTLDALYDNSAANPTNPNSPPRAVHHGEETTDEMCIAFLGYTRDREHLQAVR